MEYICILDYNKGYCEIYRFNGDPEEWLCNNGYNLNYIQQMTTQELNLKIEI